MRNFKGRKGLPQTSECNTLGLTGDGIRPNPHGDLEAGLVVGSGMEANRLAEKEEHGQGGRATETGLGLLRTVQ